jgi:hypothetical protein
VPVRIRAHGLLTVAKNQAGHVVKPMERWSIAHSDIPL